MLKPSVPPAAALAAVLLATPAPAAEVSFSREVLPILSDRCFHCHGPDPSHRKADLRLDLEAEAKRDGLLVAGDPQASELWRRVTSSDPDEVMPPADSHREPLDPAERETIRRWIEQGVPWGRHWAFEKPTRPAVPNFAPHPVDAFVRARLAAEGLEAAAPAPAHTQLRRAAFALTGLPPQATGAAIPDHLDDDASWAAYVDALLASPHHGERMAMWWLDAARYADTDGFQNDAERENWPWRDWVIEAFNSNLPFDRFTIEQFAGDLLPDATRQQILATAFHRHHMTNGEGGRDPEESRIDYVLDRVNTTGTVWLGLTLGCAQCHDHKFDPISQRDYFSLSAFFNSIDEDGQAGDKAKPYLSYRSPHASRAVAEMRAHVDARRERERAAHAAASERFENRLAEMLASHPPDYRAWRIAEPVELRSAEGTGFRLEDEGVVQTTGAAPFQDDYRVTVAAPGHRVGGWKLEVLPHPSHTGGGLSRGATGEFILTNVKLMVERDGESQLHDVELAGAVADYEKPGKVFKQYGQVAGTLDDDPRNGWTTAGEDPTRPYQAIFELAEPLELDPDERLVFVLFHRSTEGEANIGRFRLSLTPERGETVRGFEASPLEELAAGPAAPSLHQRLLAQYLLDDAPYQAELDRLEEARRQLKELEQAAGDLDVMVLREREQPRETHVLVRGVWDDKGETVTRAVPDAILPRPDLETRLDLAEWLVAEDNPLTPRVVVNHLWQLLFGQGLVRTPGDFGLQGEQPTHPALLDWLAVELVESGWDLRHLLRLIATSETFRQDSAIPDESLELDPDNRLLARFPRQRLPAWMIRDHALAASGLLNPALGGPPVRPWQPEGVWNEMFMGRLTYRPSVGPAQYRRSVYAFWRRSSGPTFFFDHAKRRVCEVGLSRTNTPLHALTLLNDRTLLEAARVLAAGALETSGPAGFLAERILSRPLAAEERELLGRHHRRALAHYTAAPEDARAFTTVGQQPAADDPHAADLAAWMSVASVILNLDEAITHE